MVWVPHITRINNWMPRDILACQRGEAAIAVSKETLSLMCFREGNRKETIGFCRFLIRWDSPETLSRQTNIFHQVKIAFIKNKETWSKKRCQGNAVPFHESKRLRTANFLVASIAWQITWGTSHKLIQFPRWYQKPFLHVQSRNTNVTGPSQGATSFAVRTLLILPNESI